MHHRWPFSISSNTRLHNLVRRRVKAENFSGRRLRKMLHLTGSLFFPILALLVPKGTLLITLGAVTILFIIAEAARFTLPRLNQWIVSRLGTMLKGEERRRPTGATFLLLGSLVVFLLFEKDIAVTSLLFVAIGDLTASVVGRKYGKLTLLDGKTLEGSLACLASCLTIGLIMMFFGQSVTISMVLYGAACATLLEMTPLPIDDNFTIPISSAIAMTVAKIILA
jgi:dolichol kinase